jgi:MFS family permease
MVLTQKIYNKNSPLKELVIKDKGLDVRSNIRKLYFYNFIIGFYLLSGVIIPFYIIWGHLTFLQFILLQSYYTIIILIFQIPCWALSDYISRKLSLFLSALFSALTMLIYLNTPSIFLFLIGETLFALAEAFIAGSNEALIYESLKEIGREKDVSRVVAKTNALFLVAMAFSAPLGPIIAYYFSLPMVVVFMFFPYIIGTFISLTLKEPKKYREKNSKNILGAIKSGFRDLKNNRVLRTLVFDATAIEVLVTALLYTYQFYLYQLSVPIIYFGFISSGLNVIEIILLNLFSKFQNLVKNKKRYLTINTVTLGIAYSLIGVVFFTPIVIILILIVFGFGFSRYIMFLNGINDQLKLENRATVLNTINTVKVFLKAILLPIVGFLVIWNINILFIIFGSLIVIFALKSRVKQEYL